MEIQHIRKVLENTGWKVRGKQGAAEMLGMKPTTLETRMAKLGIIRPENKNRDSNNDLTF
jgi:transcriptional regulator with GAF, ATPase, and Fis domain